MRKNSYTEAEFPLDSRDEMLLYSQFQQSIRQTAVQINKQVLNLEETFSPQITGLSGRRALSMALIAAKSDIVMLQKLLLRQEKSQEEWDLTKLQNWQFCYDTIINSEPANILLLEKIFEHVFKAILRLRYEADLYRGAKTTYAQLSHEELVREVEQMQTELKESETPVFQLKTALSVLSSTADSDDEAENEDEILSPSLEESPSSKPDFESIAKNNKAVEKIKGRLKKLSNGESFSLHRVVFYLLPLLKQFFSDLGNVWDFTSHDLQFIIMKLELKMVTQEELAKKFKVRLRLVNRNPNPKKGLPSRGWLAMFESAITSDREELRERFIFRYDPKKKDTRSFQVRIRLNSELADKLVRIYLPPILTDYQTSRDSQDFSQLSWDRLKEMKKGE